MRYYQNSSVVLKSIITHRTKSVTKVRNGRMSTIHGEIALVQKKVHVNIVSDFFVGKRPFFVAAFCGVRNC